MLALGASHSAGSLISIALAAGHLPHTCLKVMKTHLRECALRSLCHLLPANTTPPDKQEKAENCTAKLGSLPTFEFDLQIRFDHFHFLSYIPF